MDTVSFNIADPNLVDDITFDHVAFAKTNIPEPNTLALFLVGVAGIGFTLRKYETGRLLMSVPGRELPLVQLCVSDQCNNF